MSTRKPTVIELFAGGGGAAVGLHAAHFTHLAVVEMWPAAVATLRAAGMPAIEGRVESEAVGKTLFRATVHPNSRHQSHGRVMMPLDLLWASPPCQPYSSAGLRRGALDPRDGWDATLIRIRELRPRVVIIENVQDAPVSAWADQLRSDYPSVGSFHLLASDFGVPQSRKRAFVYAGPVSCATFRALVMEHRRAPPALDRLLPHLRGHFVRLEQTTAVARPTSGDSCPTLTTKGNLYVHKTDVGRRGQGARIDREISRPMTALEMAAIQGFPRGYPFQGGEGAARKMIGNSVPPAMALAIGIAVRRVLGY